MMIAPVVVAAVLLIWGLSGFRIIKEPERALIFRSGRYRCTKGPGLIWIIPRIESQTRIELGTQNVTADCEYTTKDGVPIKAHAIVQFSISDPVKAVSSVSGYRNAISQTAATSLRNVLNQRTMEELLKKRDDANQALTELMQVCAQWGINLEGATIQSIQVGK